MKSLVPRHSADPIGNIIAKALHNTPEGEREAVAEHYEKNPVNYLDLPLSAAMWAVPVPAGQVLRVVKGATNLTGGSLKITTNKGVEKVWRGITRQDGTPGVW